MNRTRLSPAVRAALAAAALVLPAAAVAPAVGAATAADPDPARFTTVIDNPLLPLTPGTRSVYRERGPEGRGRVVITVTHRTRVVQGVRTVVVRDRAYFRGELVEDTFDWYAQDKAGNVWYFGEAPKEFENGRVVSTAGSWEAGRDGARAGIVMKARPRVGDTYFQEHAPGVAMDQATIVSRRATVTVPVGSFQKVLKTKDFTQLEPGVVEHKFYARGFGSVLERARNGQELRLVRQTRP